jgi:hypothetical protein
MGALLRGFRNPRHQELISHPSSIIVFNCLYILVSRIIYEYVCVCFEKGYKDGNE